MEIKVEKVDEEKKLALISLKGRLDAQYSQSVEESLLDLIEKGYINLIVDLKEVDYLGSSGIRILLSFNNKLEKKEGNLLISAVPETGLKILKTMGIVDRFKIYSNKEQALEFFGR